MTFPQLPSNFGDLLVFLGTPAFIGFVLSFAAANVPAFQKLSQQSKMLWLSALAFALGVASHLLVQFVPAGADVAIQPYYDIFLNTVVILMASQVYYSKVVSKGIAARAAIANSADFSASLKPYTYTRGLSGAGGAVPYSSTPTTAPTPPTGADG